MVYLSFTLSSRRSGSKPFSQPFSQTHTQRTFPSANRQTAIRTISLRQPFHPSTSQTFNTAITHSCSHSLIQTRQPVLLPINPSTNQPSKNPDSQSFTQSFTLASFQGFTVTTIRSTIQVVKHPNHPIGKTSVQTRNQTYLPSTNRVSQCSYTQPFARASSQPVRLTCIPTVIHTFSNQSRIKNIESS